ncbi:hypothetical protein HDV02_004579 [Globomyces sp. JEL0801]|nr:hypothetical protein HDV02_004579 [Globomyces sp. JEL0801]
MNTTEKPLTTVIRIKRKREEDPLDALLVASGESADKKLKSLGTAKVFQFIESIDIKSHEISGLLRAADRHHKSIKHPTVSEESHKQKQAKEARYKIIEKNRQHAQNGLQVVDISVDEDYGLDEITCNAQAMVREFMKMSTDEKANPKDDSEAYVYDLVTEGYYQNDYPEEESDDELYRNDRDPFYSTDSDNDSSDDNEWII